ncbi:MAG: hypothetical protein J0H84_20235 [Rhizobiales bacterium]|nr:hypothetical protein [Hyphomicrobiales bacterium]
MSLALFNPGNDVERAPSYFRFTVRCDRLTNMKIEKAAKKAGLSPSAFVQAHFDRILGGGEGFDAKGFDFMAFSKRHHVGIGAARLYCLLRQEAGPDGAVKRTIYQIADGLSCSVSLAGQYRRSLVDIGLLKKVRPDNRGPEAWRVLEEGLADFNGGMGK